MRAAIYCRISRDAEGERAGVARQEEDCRAVVAREGWDLVEVYADNSRSAYAEKKRPAWTRLLGDAADGAFEAVVAWHDDRLWRNVVEQQTVFALLADAGVKVVATPGRTYSTGSSDDAFLSGIQALVAQKESADKARRIRRKHEQLARDGLPGGGVRPFGYDRDHVTVVEREAQLIRQAAGRVLAGDGLNGIVMAWNADGVTTSLGNRWTVSGLRNLLRSPRYAGLREHRGEVVGDAVWAPILTVEQHRRLRAVFDDPERRRPGPRRRYLLTGGLAVCGRCGADLQAQKRQDGTPTYGCVIGAQHGGCGRLRCKAEPLEAHIRDLVLTALDGDGLTGAVAAARGDDDTRARTVDELRVLEERLEQLEVAHFAGGQLTRAGYLAARNQLTGEIDQHRRALADDQRLGVLASIPARRADMDAWWDDASVEWRRSLVLALVERVTVMPAEGRRLFRAERAQVTWRA